MTEYQKQIFAKNLHDKGISLEYYPDWVKNDAFFVKIAVKSNGQALKFASEELRNNKEIVRLAIKRNIIAFQFASESLKDDRELVLYAIELSAWNIEHASEKLKNDKEIMMKTIQKCGYCLRYASTSLKNDRELVLRSIQDIHSSGYAYVPDQFKNEKRIVKTAIRNDYTIFREVPKKWRNHISIVHCMVRESRYRLGGFKELKIPIIMKKNRKYIHFMSPSHHRYLSHTIY